MSEQPLETDHARLWRESGENQEIFAELLRRFHRPPEGNPVRSYGDDDELGQVIPFFVVRDELLAPSQSWRQAAAPRLP